MTEPKTLDDRVVALESDRRSRGLLTLLTAIGIVLALVLAGIWVQRQNNRSIERERAARVASEQARAASEQALCQIYVILDTVYSRTPPTTPAGRELATAIAHARIVNRCPPRTKE